jgi:hypothetical protein
MNDSEFTRCRGPVVVRAGRLLQIAVIVLSLLEEVDHFFSLGV